MKYVPLHIHSEYSLLDSAIKIEELYKFAAQNDMPAVAIVDHATMAGCADMFTVKSKIKPIIGCEFYICDGNVLNDYSRKTMYHLVLIAKNKIGYNNLCKMASIASTKGFYYKPRIDHKILKQYKDGLICLSACIQGEVARKFLDGDKEEAIKTAKYYKNLFGDDYYIELQDHGLKEERKACNFLIETAKELNIKTVITNDSHYLRKSDADIHDNILCEQTYSLKNDPNRFKFINDEFYVKTADELRKIFSWMNENYFNQCIKTTVEIADKCNFEMEFNKAKEYLPKYPWTDGASEENFLDKLCMDGLKKKYSNSIPESIIKQYKKEKDIISKTGLASTFLIVWDILNYVIENKILFNDVKGELSNSITAYSLGFVKDIPSDFNLSFNGTKLPRISIDLENNRCEEVYEYLKEKWGENYVARVSAFMAYTPKTALRAICKMRNISLKEKDKITQKMINEANKIAGIKNQVKSNTTCVVISPKPMDEILPVCYNKYKEIQTQYSKGNIEKLGLFTINLIKTKFDYE